MGTATIYNYHSSHWKSLEEFKVTRAREVLQYRDSSDSKAGIEVRTGWKCKAEGGCSTRRGKIRSQQAGGSGSKRQGWTWVLFQLPTLTPSKGKERCHLVQEEVRAVTEEERTCRTVGMRQQGAWIRWENAIERKVIWAELWKAEPQRIKFLIQVVYDVLPSPS